MTARTPIDATAALFDAEAHEDVLCHSERTRVVRRRLKGSNDLVVCKETLGSDAGVRLRHERAMLERLASVPGVAHLAVASGDMRMLVLEDVSGIALAQALQGQLLSVGQKIDLALELARIVAEVHRHGVVHRDINPANILVSGPTWRPTLIDFNLASSFAEERPGFTHESAITGTLAYLAPEQTGRTSRAVDQRADLYSLGATFYELAIGRPPFEGTDPLELIRDHLARVPMSPSQVDPAVPALLSDIVMRLLEKEPDRRYQSADGLAHDLARLREHLSSGQQTRFPLGERDFALQLSAPSRLIGREAETEVLCRAFDASLHTAGRSVLVAGAPGVGKSALVGELRAIVTARGGWFVSGKFEHYRQEAASPAITQALRALGRLLLAEPKAELDRQREHLLAVLGRQAGIVTAALPEFLLLLGPQPEVAETGPTEFEAQLLQATVDLLSAVVSPARPLVMLIDDLQWGRPVALRLIERLISDPDLRGLLVVGTYRDTEIDATHPLAMMLPRWQKLPHAPQLVSLQNLPLTDVAELVAEMLRLPSSEAQRLAEALGALTSGNPFDTVELINALRRDGALRCDDTGWHWEADVLRRYIGQGTVVDLIAARIGKLPRETCLLMETMACLGNSVEMTLLHAATGIGTEELDAMLREPLEDGLLVPIRSEDAGSADAVRFRHDRVQQAAYGRLDAARREARHIALAQRLRACPDFRLQAAEQYLPAVHAVRDMQERRLVAALFRAAAARARQTVSHGAVVRWLTEAMALLSAGADTTDQPAMALLLAEADMTDQPVMALLSAGADATDQPALAELEIELHSALYALGELDKADRIYAAIEARGSAPLAVADAACVQISSLCNRNRLDDAIALGLEVLRRLGLQVDETPAGLAALQSRRRPMHDDDVLRPEVTDPRVIACGKIINRLLPVVHGAASMVWMVLESRSMWIEHGPCAALVGPVSHFAFVTMFDGDYRSGHDDVRRVLEVSEARGYEPQTSQARFLFAFSASHWFEPLEETVIHAQRAREGLLQGGDLQNACFSYLPTVTALFDCAPLLDGAVEAIEAAIALAARTGNKHAGEPFVLQRQLAQELQGQGKQTSELAAVSFDGGQHISEPGLNPFTTASMHVTCALAAALFDNDAGLRYHAEEANRYPVCT
ncbi:MAG TPA: AAA family ATPase, partial [Rhizobacter sp.]|nr:AAA family ATPase [Rhizobacter sp.]